jgi:hypothetical protein
MGPLFLLLCLMYAGMRRGLSGTLPPATLVCVCRREAWGEWDPSFRHYHASSLQQALQRAQDLGNWKHHWQVGTTSQAARAACRGRALRC